MISVRTAGGRAYKHEQYKQTNTADRGITGGVLLEFAVLGRVRVVQRILPALKLDAQLIQPAVDVTARGPV